MANDRELNYKVTLDDQLTAKQKKLADGMRETTSESKQLKAALTDMGVGFASLAAAGFGAKALQAPVRAASTMQRSLLGVKAELLANGKTMQEVNRELSLVQRNATQVQAATAFSAAEILDLQRELLKGGASLAQIAGNNGAAMAAALLAQYEGVMASYAAEGLIAIATPFNLAGDQFAYLADQITRASAASTGGFVDFAEGAKYAAPQLSALNVAIEDMLVMQAMLAQSGLKGSMGGTSLAALYSEASRSGKFSSETLRSPEALIAQLRGAVQGKDEIGSITALRELGFGDRSMKAVLSLINQDYAKMSSEMQRSAGLTDKIAVTMSGLTAQMSSLAASSQSLAALTFQPMLTPLSGTVNLLNDAVNATTELIAKYPQLSKFITTAAAAGVGTAGFYGGLRAVRGASSLPGGLRGLAGQVGRGILSGTGIGGVLKGKAMEAATGIQPVYVTNQIDEKKLAGAGNATGMLGTLGGKFAGLLRFIPYLGALITGISAISTLVSIMQRQDEEKKAAQELKDNNLNLQLNAAKQGAMWDQMLNSPTAKILPQARAQQSTISSAAGRQLLEPWQVDLFNQLPEAMRDAFTKANAETVQVPLYKMSNFAMDWLKNGSAMWANEDLMSKYSDIYAILQQDKSTQVNLKIDMKQEQTPEGIKNKEFIVNVASGNRIKTSAIRGENLRSISRNI